MESPMPPESQLSHEDLLSRPSSLPEVTVNLIGFASEQEAKEVGNNILAVLHVLGIYLELERLEAITVAFDYAEALANIDCGGFKTKPKATEDIHAVGVAMAVTVLRAPKPMKHLVMNASCARFLKDTADPNYRLALYLVAHEAAHVHDLARQDRTYPGIFGQAMQDSREGFMFTVAQSCWEEYIACILSADYAPSSQTDNYEETFCSVFADVRKRGNAHIRRYRTGRDVMRLLDELQQEYGSMLKYAAYLLGHVEGLGQTLQAAAPRAFALIQESSWFAPLFGDFHLQLKGLDESYGKWSGIEVFEPLKRTVSDVFKAGGIEFQQKQDGTYYISVPFTYDTV
jgi:hypothetical protein